MEETKGKNEGTEEERMRCDDDKGCMIEVA